MRSSSAQTNAEFLLWPLTNNLLTIILFGVALDCHADLVQEIYTDGEIYGY